MAKKILFARAKVNEDERNIYCNDLDKEDYDSTYKGHLTCINGCKARIKFTQKKNNSKFFSTWNKEGKLHNKDCPYFVEYKGIKGRQKLNAYYKSIELDDDTIFNRIKRKYNELHKSYKGNEYPVPDKGSMEIENIGEKIVDTAINEPNGSESSDGSNIRHKRVSTVTTDDLGSIISVYGVIDNVWLDQNKDGTKFAYINYATPYTSVNILFSESFYSNEYSKGVEEFERFIAKVQSLVNNSKNPVEAIAYGEITKKKRRESGVNVSVYNPKRILIDGMSYNQILYKDVTKNV